MDVFLLILCLVVIVILLLVNLYLMAFYSHVEDQGSHIAILCKIIVVFTLLQCQGQQLLLTVDASNSRAQGGGFNMPLLWQIFYLSIFANLGLLLPFSIFLYETDFEQPLWKRVAITLCEIVITVGAVCVLTFVTYIFLNRAEIPITLVKASIFTESLDDTTILVGGTSANVVQFDFQVGIPYYIMGIMCFFGYFILVLCGGCGLSALPLDLIMQFRLRPKHIRTSEAKAKKEEFKVIVADLIAQGERLKTRMKEMEYSTGWWSKRKREAEVIKDYAQFEEEANESDERFELYKMELDIQNTSMVTFVAKLILGVFCVFLSFLWWFQILFSQLVKVKDKKLSGVVDGMLIWLEGKNANFVGVIWFMVMTQYLVFCILKGSFRFGVRIPFLFSFHPMKEGKTWMNSFLFNLSIAALGSVAIVHLCSGCFEEYLRSTSISSIFMLQISHLRFFKYFFESKAFVYALLIWTPLVAIYVVIRGVQKPDLLKRIQQKRKKLKIRPAKEYEMTEVPPKDHKSHKKQPRKDEAGTDNSLKTIRSSKRLPRTQKRIKP